MDDKVPDFLEFDEPKLLSLTKNENVLKLDDPPEQDNYVSINVLPYHPDRSEGNPVIEDLTGGLLNLTEPPKFDSIYPIVNEAFERFISEAEYIINEGSVETNDSGFIQMPKSNVSEDVKRDFGDSMIQKELGLESYSDEYIPVDSTSDSIIKYIPNESTVDELHSDEYDEHDFNTQLESNPLFSNIVTLDYNVCSKCRDIISWSHPVSSALVFSILMFVELGLMMEYSIIALLAFLGLIFLVVKLVFKFVVSLQLFNVQSSFNGIITFDKKDAEYCVNAILNGIDYIHKEITSIAFVESMMKNIKVFAIFGALTYIGQMFNLRSLIFIGSLLLFSLPAVYNKYERQINNLVGNIRDTNN